MSSLPSMHADPTGPGLAAVSLKVQLLGALVALIISVGISALWHRMSWPASRFASPVAFFLMLGAFSVWKSPRARSSPVVVKVVIMLMHGSLGLLVGWLSGMLR